MWMDTASLFWVSEDTKIMWANTKNVDQQVYTYTMQTKQNSSISHNTNTAY
jgi:hypothetical protein